MVARIPLSRGLVALVDDPDFEAVSRFRWHAYPGNYGGRMYAKCSQGAYPDLLHRWLLEAPEGMEVDHRDGDGLNNQRSNLRLCTRAQNAANCRLRKDSTTGFKGVLRSRYNPNKFHAHINLGTFASAEEAARAYDRIAILVFGEFARLNFPQDGGLFISPNAHDNLTTSTQD